MNCSPKMLPFLAALLCLAIQLALGLPTNAWKGFRTLSKGLPVDIHGVLNAEDAVVNKGTYAPTMLASFPREIFWLTYETGLYARTLGISTSSIIQKVILRDENMSILSGVNPIKVDLFRADNGLPLWTTNLDKTLPALTQQTYNTKQPNTDLIFVEDEEQQRLSVAALIDGSHVAYVENGKVLWSWNNDLGALVLHRLTTSGNKLVAVGTTGSELAVLGFHLVDGDRFTTGFLKLGSAAVPGQIIVVGEKMERYVVILTENNRVQILDLRTETLTDLATKQSDFNPTRRLISGLVQLGTESTLMQDFIVQFVDHSEVVVRLSSQEGFTVLTTPQTKSASVILTQGYLEDFYAYARVEEISPTETALSFIDLDTGALLEAHQFEHNTKEHGSIISGYIDIQIDSNGFVVWQLAAATSKGTLVSWKGTNVEAVAQDEVNPSFAALQDGHDEADNIDDDDDEEEPYYVHYSIKQKMPKTKAPEHKEL